MTEEYRQALVSLENARAKYEIVEENFEGAAFRELQAAEERVLAIIRERRIKYTE